MKRRQIAWILILIIDVAYVAWGAMAAAMPMACPDLDWIVNAIGPFELTEYLGLALVWGALAATAPFRPARRPVPAAG
jgi:hypothetical protein